MENLELHHELSRLTARKYYDRPIAFILVLLTVITVLASNVFGLGLPTTLIAIAGGFVSVCCVALGLRQRHRDSVHDEIAERVSSIAHSRTVTRRVVTCSRWSHWYGGMPRKVVIRVARAVERKDIKWQNELLLELWSIVEMTPKITKLKRRHVGTVVTVEFTPEVETDQTGSEAVEPKVNTVVKELLGEDAQITLQGEQEEPELIEIVHTQGTNMSFGNRRLRVQTVINTRLPGRWESSWDLENDKVTFKRKHPIPDLVLPDPVHAARVTTHQEYEDFRVIYGMAENNEEVFWRPNKQPHMLVVGPTGSGKTVLLTRILYAATQAGWRCRIVDGKRIEFIGFRNWPNVELLGAKVEHQVRMIVETHAEMERRYSLIENGEASVADFEPILLVIDEVATLLKRIERWWKTVRPKGSPTKPPILDLLADMARLSRSAKIHMLLGLQRPDVEFLNGEMRDNFAARAALGRMSPNGAQMMWEHAGIGTSIPRGKQGRGFSTTLDGRIVETQFHLVPNPDPMNPSFDMTEVEKQRPQEVVWPLMHVEDLEPETPDIDGKMIPTMYDDYIDARILPGPSPTWKRSTTPREDDQASVVPSAGSTATLTREAELENIEDYGVPDDEYAEAPGDGFRTEIATVLAENLDPGDLVMIDEECEIWVVVEDVEEGPTGIMVDFRDFDTGTPESMSLDSSMRLSVRKPYEFDENNPSGWEEA